MLTCTVAIGFPLVASTTTPVTPVLSVCCARAHAATSINPIARNASRKARIGEHLTLKFCEQMYQHREAKITNHQYCASRILAAKMQPFLWFFPQSFVDCSFVKLQIRNHEFLSV